MSRLSTLLLLLSAPAFGQEVLAIDGPFRAFLFLTDDSHAIYDDWNNSPPGEVDFHELSSTTPGEVLEGLIVFSGCEPDEHGKCQLIADWAVTTLSGEPFTELKDVPVWLNQPAPPPGYLHLSDKGFGFQVGNEHDGYIFKVTIRDRVSGRSLELADSIEVVGT